LMFKEKCASINSSQIEKEFLISCSRISIDEKLLDRIKRLASSILDWQSLTYRASRHGVAQFLYSHLPKIDEVWGKIPEECRNSLKQSYYNTLMRNTSIKIELQKIITLLHKADKQIIVLKGASLLDTVYQNIALRPMVDVDLLVKKKDLSEIKTILEDYGYCKPDFLSLDSLEKFGGEIHLCKRDISLDIHSSLAQYERFQDIFKIDLDEEIWDKSVVIKTQEGERRILHPDHLFMHLCLHQAIAHYFRGLFRFCDLRETILAYQKEIDWQYIIAKAKTYRIRKIIYYSLSFMQELFGRVLPEDTLKRLKPRILSCFFVSKRNITSLPNEEIYFKKSVAQLFLMDSLLVVPKIILRGLFPSNEWLKYRYGIDKKMKLIFYRIFHPFITVFNILS